MQVMESRKIPGLRKENHAQIYPGFRVCFSYTLKGYTKMPKFPSLFTLSVCFHWQWLLCSHTFFFSFFFWMFNLLVAPFPSVGNRLVAIPFLPRLLEWDNAPTECKPQPVLAISLVTAKWSFSLGSIFRGALLHATCMRVLGHLSLSSTDSCHSPFIS